MRCLASSAALAPPFAGSATLIKTGFGRMDDLRLSDVRLVLADPRHVVRNSLRMALNDAGFVNQNIRDGGDASVIAEAMSEGFGPDIVICDNDVRDGDLARLIAAIRHGEVGSNPFVSIIAISWKATENTVNQILNTGADLIVAAPFSPQQVLDRIRSLVHSRKKFIVTTDYIGPDRREGMNRSTTGAHAVLPLIDAPNSLRDKALGEWDPVDYREKVSAALSTVNDQKMVRHAQQLSALAEQVAMEYTARAGEIDRQRLDRLMVSAADLIARSSTAALPHVGELAEAVRTLLTDLRRPDGGSRAKQVELLRQLAYAVRQAVVPNEGTATIAHDIASTISGVKRN
jgi:DNA-binding response OmpR family regulator